MIQLACRVFPEYANAIRGNNDRSRSISSSADSNDVVYRESKKISDTETISITQLSSGDVIIIKEDSADITYTASTSDITNVGVSGTATFQVSMADAYFKLKNVAFTIYETGSDYFTNYGTVNSSTFYSYTLIENSSSCIEYSLRGGASSTQFIRFKLYFQNNQLIATA